MKLNRDSLLVSVGIILFFAVGITAGLGAAFISPNTRGEPWTTFHCGTNCTRVHEPRGGCVCLCAGACHGYNSSTDHHGVLHHTQNVKLGIILLSVAGVSAILFFSLMCCRRPNGGVETPLLRPAERPQPVNTPLLSPAEGPQPAKTPTAPESYPWFQLREYEYVNHL